MALSLFYDARGRSHSSGLLEKTINSLGKAYFVNQQFFILSEEKEICCCVSANGSCVTDTRDSRARNALL